MCERPILPLISQIYADETQKPKTTLTSPTCLSLRNNAALLHSSASSALSAGEYSRKSTQSISTNETPISPADSADLRRQTTKPQNSLYLKQTVFLCVIMQLAAFLCVICAICGRIYTQAYSINIAQTKPQCLPQITQIYADKQQQQQNYKNSLNLKQPVFLCEIMQPAAFLCAICVICGRIFTQEYSIY